MQAANVHLGDILDYCAAYQGERYHALLCDPPYHLTSIQKRFSGADSAPAQYGRDGAFQRASAGFMGKKWDGGDIAFRPETWAALAGLLHPGAFMMAFAGTRGYHRMACAMEDAGLIIHPALGWAFGSGFPKATRVKGAEKFSGHRYGLQALKPAFEFIAVAQVPYQGRPVDSITRTGAGALNVDGGRIPANGHEDYNHLGNDGIQDRRTVYGKYANGNQQPPSELGRWPANLLLSHSPECNGVCVDGCAVKAMGGSDGAARFFHNSDWALENSDPFIYAAKAGRRERDAGLEGMPRNPHPTVKPIIRLTQHLAALLLPPAEYAPRRLLVPFAGSGSEMIGAMLAGWDVIDGIELESEYAEIARARLAHWATRQPELIPR